MWLGGHGLPVRVCGAGPAPSRGLGEEGPLAAPLARLLQLQMVNRFPGGFPSPWWGQLSPFPWPGTLTGPEPWDTWKRTSSSLWPLRVPSIPLSLPQGPWSWERPQTSSHLDPTASRPLCHPALVLSLLSQDLQQMRASQTPGLCRRRPNPAPAQRTCPLLQEASPDPSRWPLTPGPPPGPPV